MAGQHRRPRTRPGRILHRLFGDGLAWLWIAAAIIGAAIYYSVPAHAEPVCPGDAGYAQQGDR